MPFQYPSLKPQPLYPSGPPAPRRHGSPRYRRGQTLNVTVADFAVFSLCRTSELLPSRCVGQTASISFRVRQLCVVSDPPIASTHHRRTSAVLAPIPRTILSVLAWVYRCTKQVILRHVKMSRSSIILQYNVHVCMVCV